MLKYMVLKSFYFVLLKKISAAPQPEGEGTKPGHSATKSGADTHGAMRSFTEFTYSVHFGSLHTCLDCTKFSFTVYSGSVSNFLSLSFTMPTVPNASSQTERDAISSGSPYID